MDGWSPSLFFLPPASRPACLVVVTATGPVIGGRGGKEGGRLLERSRWLVDLAGWYIGQALRVSFSFRRDGWILGDGSWGGGGREDIRVLLCLLCAGRLGVEWTGERVMVVVVVV